MYIKKLELNNFKGISEMEVKPKKINLIVGRNNTGKTTLIESINLANNIPEINRHYKGYLSKLININSEKASITIATEENKKIKLEFKKPSIQNVGIDFKRKLINAFKEYLTKVEKRKLTKELENYLEKVLNNILTPKILLDLSQNCIFIIINGKKKIYYPVHFLRQNESIENGISENITNKLNKKFNSYFDSFMLQLFIAEQYKPDIKTNNKSKKVIFIKNPKSEINLKGEEGETTKIYKIENIIKEYKLIKNLKRFSFEYLSFEDSPEIPYDFMGDGFKQLVGILWCLSDVKDKVVLIEEPETNMHPGYIGQLMKFILELSEKMNIQFFITTHNIDSIESFFNEEILSKKEKKYLEKEFSILRLEKIKNHIILNEMSYKKAKEDRKDLLMDLRGI
ncbi:MAG: AAA family ATPase [Candidatus Aenigmarchaeota archaeon]|nr:AAA family ATPase [Candidatus Aenigmarchaeota archaeon]